MKRLLLVLVALVVCPPVARASTIFDPLHGFCGSSFSTSTCTDNGTITPVSGALGTFGFVADPNALTGIYEVEVLVPNNLLGASTESFTITETSPAGSALSDNEGLWNSGDLGAFLGFNSSPANPLSAYLGPCAVHVPPNCTTGIDPGATGYYVYEFNLGTTTLPNQTGSPVPLLTLSGSVLPAGSVITAFLLGAVDSTEHPDVATAPSGALLLEGPGPGGNGPTGQSPVPEPVSLLLFGSGLALVASSVRRMKKRR